MSDVSSRPKKLSSTVAVSRILIIGVLTYLLSLFVGAFLQLGFTGNNPSVELEPWQSFVVLLVISYSIFIFVWAGTKYLTKKKNVFGQLSLKRPTRRDIGHVFLGFGLYIILRIAVFGAIALLCLNESLNIDQTQDTGFNDPSGFGLILTGIGLVIMVPFAEELLFRGFLYTNLKKHLGRVGAGLVVSGLFGLVHGQWNVGIDTFLLSVAMIYIFEETKNLSSTVMLHMLKNFIAFLAVFVFSNTL